MLWTIADSLEFFELEMCAVKYLDSQAASSFLPPAFQNSAPTLGLHPFAETVIFFAA